MLRSAISCVVSLGLLASPALARRHVGHHRIEGAAAGDSLALGFGAASGLATYAIVGISSCGAVWRVPTRHVTFLLLSGGTNDPPGPCIERMRARANADRVMWVIPVVPSARQHVLRVAQAHHDATLFYTPGTGRLWPHPAHYWNVLRAR